MKVNELRENLSKLKKEEIIKIASEFYKLIPKAKKEDYDLDSFINNPSKRQKKTSSKQQIFKLYEIEIALSEFIEYAKEQYYLIPNRKVPKKERSTWRFKVKKWYKELTNTKRLDKDLEKQSKLLSDLYELICESCGFQYFSAYDSFQSIGIDQSVFYSSVITLLQESKGKLETVEKSIELIINNYVNRYTLYSDLMRELISTFESSDLKYRGIEMTKKLIKENNFNPKERNRRRYSSSEVFRKKENNNNLSEFGLRLYISLYEMEEGIEFYNKHYHYGNKEIKLYVLICILFELRKKDDIVKEMEKAIDNGIQPRKNLRNLLDEIKESNELPEYMR